MANQTLTIEGITFPDFGDDKSKKNFRLIFYIAYKGDDGKTKTTIVTKPPAGFWQWRNPNKKFFLQGTTSGDSVELDTSALQFDDETSGFTSADAQIAEIDGTISSIAVQFIDVKDDSLGGLFAEKFLPKLIDLWKTSGFNPLDLVPLPGIVTGIVKDNVDLGALADKAEGFLAQGNGDKVLHRINKKYDGTKPFVISDENVVWDTKKNKKGTYAATIGFE
ncbi:MAG TPA: hypothetical protein VGC76_18230 [Pyrinomonadaceae bacterium]|jgi:hypothetical protein